MYCHLTYKTHVADLMPFLSEHEQSTVKNKVAPASHLTIISIFDGTSRLREGLGIVFWYVDCDFEIHQSLLHFSVLSKSLLGSELAPELIAVMSTQLQVPSSKV